MKKIYIILLTLMLVNINANANHGNTLTIYTYDSFISEWGPWPEVEKSFEKICNCNLEFVGLDSSIGILGRLKLEGLSSEADVILGLDTNLIHAAEKTGLLVEHKIDLSDIDIPVKWDHKIFLPFDWGHFAFIYDETKADLVEKVVEETRRLKRMRHEFEEPIPEGSNRNTSVRFSAIHASLQHRSSASDGSDLSSTYRFVSEVSVAAEEQLEEGEEQIEEERIDVGEDTEADEESHDI